MTSEMLRAIEALAESKRFPDADSYRALPVASVRRLSETFGVPGRQIEAAALDAGIVPDRYARNMKMFSLQDQATLLRASVSVVGLGGLGGSVTEILARTGVGTLNLIDGDRFEDHNLNRQLLSTESLLSTFKADAAVERVRQINGSLTANRCAEFLTAQSAQRLLGRADVVVDCLDSLHTRILLEDAAKQMNVPLVSAAIAGGSGHVTVIFPQDPGLRLIYGERVDPSLKGAEASLGCLCHAVFLLASLECSEVAKIILKKGAPIRNRLLVVDLYDNTFELLNLTP